MKNDAVFVIFGITGDLAKRKLLPALYRLADLKLTAGTFRIVGTTRRNTSVEDVITEIRKTVDGEVHEDTLDTLRGVLSMVNMDIAEPNDYALLKAELERIDASVDTSLNRLFYLAVPPEMFTNVVGGLGAQNLNAPSSSATESRLLIEKPFGSDTASAVELIRYIETVFPEQFVYRVDHYLAKETAQNIITFRTSNPIFRSSWNRESIDHIVLTASEQIGIEGRVNFYEKTGALRDLIQSHLLQLLSLIAMDEPADRSAESLHASKLALLRAIKPIAAADVASRTVRGQYESYRTEVDNPESRTETYAAVRLAIHNDRWRDVPVFLQTGKAMKEKITEITIVFKSRNIHSDDNNMLTLSIQPNEGIELNLRAKRPSLNDETQTVTMKFDYDESFTTTQPDAYERVLVDAIRGDKTLFTTDDEVLTSWRIIENVLTEWAKDNASMHTYAKGTWGPEAAQALVEESYADWHTH